MIPVLSLVKFRELRSKEGYFVVTDINGKKIHTTRCKTIDASTFKEKVLDNESASGKYFFFTDIIAAQEAFKVKKCDE
ncbi:hypothetical protein [Paenibacillus sp. FSL H7-0331]|uniref:hypothetical protein n=1 Tax=Paenibacillus sp. FSL H7-0331 TaxID=1920421 RepID=UPI00096D3110|nr:hypothetical protein [Paenibacillus sp. FSL H7-0331]OME97903.1 hypothetical protein BK127_39995 [Paenibacillus sp. FSL H7-0331]